MQDLDRVAEANQAIDRRARQRHAAALAQAELTPEAIALEEERQRRNAAGEGFGVAGELISQDESQHVDMDDPDLQAKLYEALMPLTEGEEVQPEIIGIGRVVFQWILVPAEVGEGYQLGIQLQVDEQPPAGFEADVTPELLASWGKGKGLQGNRVEHRQFVAMLFERALTVGAGESGNQLIYILEQLMLDTTRIGEEDEPTETSVGDDGPFADAPENADEVPE